MNKSALLAFTLLLSLTGQVRGGVFTGEGRNDQFTVHGRLSCYNGSANLRIWIIGSTRMLYIDGSDTPALARINRILGDGGDWFNRDIDADFTVEPLARDIPGHMRPVRVISVKHVVITKDDKVIAKRDEL